MYKILRMVKRRADTSLREFKEFWLQAHADVLLRAIRPRSVQKVVASFSTGEIALGGKEAQFDGMSSIYFSTLQEARAALAGPLVMAICKAETKFIDPAAAPVQMLAEEYLMSQKAEAGRLVKASGQLKILRTVYRRRDLTHQQFKDYWLNNHSRLEERVIAESPILRIVATFVLEDGGQGGGAGPSTSGLPADTGFAAGGIDGLVELYFGGIEDIRAMFAGPIPAMMRKDEENFVQMDAPAIRAVAEEYVVA